MKLLKRLAIEARFFWMMVTLPFQAILFVLASMFIALMESALELPDATLCSISDERRLRHWKLTRLKGEA